jgi:hypothetical protein
VIAIDGSRFLHGGAPRGLYKYRHVDIMRRHDAPSPSGTGM